MPKFKLADNYVDQSIEQSLIAAIVERPNLYLEVMSITAVDAFSVEYETFAKVGTAIEEGQELPEIPDWESSVDPLSAAKRLNELYQFRLYADALQSGIEGIQRSDQPPLSHIDKLEEKLTDIIQLVQEQKRQRVESVCDLWLEVSRDLHERHRIIQETGKSVIGIETGIKSLDEMLGGLQPGLSMLVARPSVGKTSLAVQIALNACSNRVPVLFLSFEEPKNRLSVRAVCSMAELIAKDYMDGREDPAILDHAYHRYRDQLNNFYIIESYKGITLNHVRARAHQLIYRYKREHHHQRILIIVDYLQKVARSLRSSPDTDFRFDVGQIASQLRSLGLSDLGCPILLLSAQNRASGGKAGNDTISDSGQVEFDADSVLFLSVDSERDQGDGSAVDLVVTKNRWGSTGTIPLVFRKDISRFHEVEH